MYLEFSQGKIINPYSGCEFDDLNEDISHCKRFNIFKANFGHMPDFTDVLDTRTASALFDLRTC